jgi:hypothetical protein
MFVATIPRWLLCGGIRFDDLDVVSMGFVFLDTQICVGLFRC